MRKVGGVIKFNAICASILLAIATFYIINKTKLIHAGLKTVISELPPSSTALAASICKKITGRLTSAISKVGKSKIDMEFFYCEVMTITVFIIYPNWWITCLCYVLLVLYNVFGNILHFQQEDVSVQLEALDILGDLLSRFGGYFLFL